MAGSQRGALERLLYSLPSLRFFKSLCAIRVDRLFGKIVSRSAGYRESAPQLRRRIAAEPTNTERTPSDPENWLSVSKSLSDVGAGIALPKRFDLGESRLAREELCRTEEGPYSIHLASISSIQSIARVSRAESKRWEAVNKIG